MSNCCVFDFECRCACKMKVAVCMVITVVILSSGVQAQDVHDAAAPLHTSETDVKEREDQSESEDEIFDDSVTDAVDRDEDVNWSEWEDEHFEDSFAEADRDEDAEPSLESTQIETLYDTETYPAEVDGEMTDRDAASEFQDAEELESESKDTLQANQQQVSELPPPSDESIEQQVSEFPPPFDESIMESSNVAQVVNF